VFYKAKVIFSNNINTFSNNNTQLECGRKKMSIADPLKIDY